MQNPTARRSSTLLLILAASVLLSSRSALAASFTPMGDLLGGAEFFASVNAVSPDGRLLAGRRTDAAGSSRAFVWDRLGGIRFLEDLPSFPPGRGSSSVEAVSALGVAVGTSGGGFSNAVVWDVSTGALREDLGTSGSLSAVSADGTAAAGTTRGVFPNIGSEQAYRWDLQGGLQMLGVLPGTAPGASVAYGISADGSRVVGKSTSSSVSSFEAFVWDSAGGMQGLGTLGPVGGVGARFSEARSISGDGRTIVGSTSSAQSQTRSAFVWTAERGMRDIGFGTGLAVSANGSVVVGAEFVESFIGRAFIWNEIEGRRDLVVLLASLGVDVEGWELIRATGISADGNTIVGIGRNPQGRLESFHAVVPEPSTSVLIGLGFIGLASRREVGRWRRNSARSRGHSTRSA